MALEQLRDELGFVLGGRYERVGGENGFAVAGLDLPGCGRLHHLDVEFGGLEDALGDRAAVKRGEDDAGALAPCPAGASRTVQQGFGIHRQVGMDDQIEIGQIDTARGDVGGDQHVHVALAEGLERLLAGDLAQVAVHRADLEAALGELVGDLLRGALGAGEDHRGAAALGLQNPGDQFTFVQRMRPVHELCRAIVNRRIVRLLGPDMRRPGEESTGQRDDRTRHGRREQHGLPFIGHHAENAFDIGQEAQIEHLVGLVQHQDAHFSENQMLLIGEIQQTAGSADDDIHAFTQGRDLGIIGATAVNGGHPQRSTIAADVFRRVLQVLGHLQAQFARRHDDQCARGAVQRGGPGFHGADPMQQRDAEPEGFAHPRTGLADEILTAQRQRQSQFLDCESTFDTHLAQSAHDFGAHPQFGERRCGMSGIQLGCQQRFRQTRFRFYSDLAQVRAFPRYRATRARGVGRTGRPTTTTDPPCDIHPGRRRMSAGARMTDSEARTSAQRIGDADLVRAHFPWTP